MKIPRVDRSQVTPKSLEERWPREDTLTETNVLDGSVLFGKSEPEGLAMAILDYSVKRGGWMPFRADELPGDRGVWLQRFVRAALLVEAGGWYVVTDLLILWFADHLRGSATDKLTQSVRRFVRSALDLDLFVVRAGINHLYDGTLYPIQERFGGE